MVQTRCSARAAPPPDTHTRNTNKTQNKNKHHHQPGADGGDVVRLDVVDDVADGVDALLHGERELVVVGAQELRDAARGDEVGRPW